MTSALYVIKRIKQKFPELIIVIGGSTFSGSTTPDFFKLFTDVDVVVNGEGELPFSQLVGCLKASPVLSELPRIRGIVTARTTNIDDASKEFQQTKV
jgi:radical SAM superfamily enzyme YgiQ (UPF0313 family)